MRRTQTRNTDAPRSFATCYKAKNLVHAISKLNRYTLDRPKTPGKKGRTIEAPKSGSAELVTLVKGTEKFWYACSNIRR